MNDQEINIAIAEACGWKWYRIPHSEKNPRGAMKTLFHPAAHEIDQDPIWLQPGQPQDGIADWEYMKRDGMVFDYCHDLNAMHEAEATLSYMEKDFYNDRLWEFVAKTNDSTPADKCYGVWHATARQRAEAFLRTKGLWKP